MAEASHLLHLAAQIQAKVATIHQQLSANGQPEPSFTTEQAFPSFAGLEDTRSSTLDLLLELQELLLTPLELLQSRPATDLVSRHALDRFNVYKAVPPGTTRTYAEIADAVKLPVSIVRRLIRHSITQRVFCEPSPGVVAHSHASRLLAENAHVYDYYGTVTNEVWPAAVRVTDAIEEWPSTFGDRDPAKSGYALAKGCTIKETLRDQPVAYARYSSAMAAYHNDQSYSTDHIARNFDWAALGAGTVVDVAGGIGTVSRALAASFPALKFVVQDLGEVIDSAVADNHDNDAGITDRIRFMEHDMFDPQPVAAADVYFFRRVLMEWDDAHALRILHALKPAMKPGHSRVLIADIYTPEPGACPLWQERKFRGSDFLALAISNSASREREQWEDLFRLAGPGFQVRSITAVKNADVVLIEALWLGE